MIRRVLADPVDLVFNIAEGQGVSRSREARVPAVLEMLGIPCTGSDPLTLAATLDKDCARRLVRSHGGLTPWGAVWEPGDDPAALGRPGHDALPGHRQAGLGRLEQGHPRQVRRRHAGRPARGPRASAATSASRCSSRSTSRARS